jgi:hypothetical protein
MNKYLLLPWALFLSACQYAAPNPGCSPSAQEQASWSQAVRANTADAYRSYLAEYPSGCYLRTATERLRRPVNGVAVNGVAVPGVVQAGVGAGTTVRPY